jgi:hypothetical protein
MNLMNEFNESNENLEIEEVQSQFEVKHISKKKKMANYETPDDTILNVEKRLPLMYITEYLIQL